MKAIHSLKLLLLLPLTLILLLALLLIYTNITHLGNAHHAADHAQQDDLRVIGEMAGFARDLARVQQRMNSALQGAISGELNELQLYRLHSEIVNELDRLSGMIEQLSHSQLVQDANHGSARGLQDAFAEYQRFIIMTTDVLAVDPAVAGDFLQTATGYHIEFSVYASKIKQLLAKRAQQRNSEHTGDFELLMQRLLYVSLSVLVLVFAVALYVARRSSSNMIDIAEGLSQLAHQQGSRIELPRIEYLNQHSHGELKLITGKLLDFRHALQRQREAEEKAFQLAFHDPLTGLPNRRLLDERLQQAIGESRRHALISALLVLDLDAFKQVNNSRGHNVGDQLLQEVARRLATAVKSSDTVARIGGNAFAILLPAQGASLAEAASRAVQQWERLADSIIQPVVLGATPLFISAGCGITLFDSTTPDSSQPLKQAEAAMYRAKTDGRNRMRFFDAAIQQQQAQQSELENDLRRALELDQLVLFFQLQADASGQPRGVEALLRWQHPQRGRVAPDLFISLAESSDLILPIGEWVLHSACQLLHQWAARPARCGLSIAVNVSARQFRQHDFVERVQQVLADTGAPPARLKLEITESLVIENIEQTVAKMHALRELGVRLSLDDFGTGYSSLQYLKRMPLDQLKIEQSFARDVETDSSSAAIVQAIIAMGQALSIEVIAEGVETAGQQAFLQRLGCQLYQGYLYSKPLPLAQLESLLDRYQHDT